MSDKITVLAAELEAIRAEIVELDAVEEPTEEQAARAEQLLKDWDDKKSAHDAAVERAARVEAVRQAALNPRNVEPAFHAPEVIVRKDPFDNLEGVRSGYVSREDLRGRALNAIDAMRDVPDDYRQRAAELARDPGIARHMLLTGSPEYREDFSRWLADPVHYRGTAMTLTDANGGYMVPFVLDPTIVLTNSGSDNPFRQISRVETTSADTWNGVTSAGVDAQWLAEATEAAEAGPTFGAISITPAKAFAEITATYEVLQDSNFEAQLPRLLADAKNRLEGAAFAVGSGSGAPKGVVTAVTAVTASRVSPTTGGAFTTASIADVFTVINGLPPRHRARSSWIANFATFNIIRRMDSSGGSAFWANLAGPTTPEELLGLPVYAASSMVSTVTTGSNILLAGDFSEFIIVDRVGMSVSYDPNVRGASYRHTGQGQFTAFWRVGSDVGNVDAFRVLKL